MIAPEFLQVLPYKDNGIAADWIKEQSETSFVSIAIRQNLYHLKIKCGDGNGDGDGDGDGYGDGDGSGCGEGDG